VVDHKEEMADLWHNQQETANKLHDLETLPRKNAYLIQVCDDRLTAQLMKIKTLVENYRSSNETCVHELYS
jgi:hypothetical protein